MKFFTLSLGTMLVRYYLMMACVVIALFIGQPLLALLAIPLFLSAVLGISFRFPAHDASRSIFR